MDHPVSPSTPTRRGTTTDRSRSSSSGEIRIVHVSEKSTESVPPANIKSRADAPAEVADPAQLAGPADTAYPPQGADLARQAGSAGEPEFTRGEQPCQPGTAGPSRRPVAPARRAWMGRPGHSHQHVPTQQALLTRPRTSLQLGHTVSPCHV